MSKRFTEEQIIGVLREAEAGAKVAELLRKPATSSTSRPRQFPPIGRVASP